MALTLVVLVLAIRGVVALDVDALQERIDGWDAKRFPGNEDERTCVGKIHANFSKDVDGVKSWMLDFGNCPKHIFLAKTHHRDIDVLAFQGDGDTAMTVVLESVRHGHNGIKIFEREQRIELPETLLGFQLEQPTVESAHVKLRATRRRPNVVFILTDDQDVLLGGADYMPQLKRHIIDKGVTFSRGFTTTPICCPSRGTTLTGMYAHNLKAGELGWCGNVIPTHQNQTYARWLHDQGGYRTGFFGKFLNNWAEFCFEKNEKRLQDWPGGPFVGWDRFFVMCSSDNYYGIQINDQGNTFATDEYLTSIIGNQTIAWLKSVAYGTDPFLLYVGPHAPHVPATPAPWYEDRFLGETAPRTPNWNFSTAGQGRHWQIDALPYMSKVLADGSDELHVARLQSLLSVDDIIEEIFDILEDSKQIENTYIIYTSDHGYNLGQFCLPTGKFQLYENDIRVPFYIRGPGIPANVTRHELVANVDISPTIVDMAGVTSSLESDGRSLLHLFRDGNVRWRSELLLEYWGNYVERGCSCNKPRLCVTPCQGGPEYSALEDAPSNTFSALRTEDDFVYAEYRGRNDPANPEHTNATEMYDLNRDPWQMENVARVPQYDERARRLAERLWSLANCRARSCP